MFGWATAWSFDRLRLWLEKGIAPERSRNQAIAHSLAVGGLAGTWLYQGRVPKLWRADEAEVRLWQRVDLKPVTRAFNPVALKVTMAALAGIALATAHDLPSGRRPLRAAPDPQPDVGKLP
jgi:hypothetical protein